MPDRKQTVDDPAEPTKYTVKNTSPGPRGLNTPDGVVVLEKGETREVEMIDAEVAMSKRAGWFDFNASKDDKQPQPQTINPATATDDELRAFITSTGEKLTGRETHADLVTMARALV